MLSLLHFANGHFTVRYLCPYVAVVGHRSPAPAALTFRSFTTSLTVQPGTIPHTVCKPFTSQFLRSFFIASYCRFLSTRPFLHVLTHITRKYSNTVSFAFPDSLQHSDKSYPFFSLIFCNILFYFYLFALSITIINVRKSYPKEKQFITASPWLWLSIAAHHLLLPLPTPSPNFSGLVSLTCLSIRYPFFPNCYIITPHPALSIPPFATCYTLYDTYYSPSALYYSPSTTYHSPSATYYSPSATYYSPSAHYHSLSATHYSLSTAHYSPSATHYSLSNPHYSPSVTYYSPSASQSSPPFGFSSPAMTTLVNHTDHCPFLLYIILVHFTSCI